MKNIEFPLGYQKTLIYANLESLSPVHMLPEIGGGQFAQNPEQWKNCVIKFISRNLKAGLIEGFPISQPPFDFTNAFQIEEALIKSDPTGNPEIWMAMQFSGTSELNRILSVHDLNNWNAFHDELNAKFIDALKEKYELSSAF